MSPPWQALACLRPPGPWFAFQEECLGWTPTCPVNIKGKLRFKVEVEREHLMGELGGGGSK
ncbi:hypothetical protein L873DRAFT_1823783 [Choiromyces venosus 120613-1]|uniref:Uncharacterized protein n=1 Tax=Choiromyces venosus 120613-1 TaxID=1336337 RepID=A0A3N4IVU5_9PEZI|nr:hypothetical protein L873DRAFT_1823783 [Choiromyces venosus 120613-1]